MDSRIEKALAEIDAIDKRDNFYSCGAAKAAEILRRHLSEPHPIIADLEALLPSIVGSDFWYKLNRIIAKYKVQP